MELTSTKRCRALVIRSRNDVSENGTDTAGGQRISVVGLSVLSPQLDEIFLSGYQSVERKRERACLVIPAA